MQASIDWKAKGKLLKVGSSAINVFTIEWGNTEAPASKTLLLIHGFPESSYSWHKVVDELLVKFDRIILFDFPGFGWSDKPREGFSYSLIDQADIALLVWRALGISGGHILSHDMGVSVATELVAREVNQLLPYWFSEGIQSYTFTNGSMVTALASLRITQRILLTNVGFLFTNLTTLSLFRHQINSAHGNNNLSEEDIQLLWHQLTLQNGHRKGHLLIKYYKDRIKFEKSRWLPALAKTKVPIHLCWGDQDQVAKIEMAHYLKNNICPTARLSIMPGVGHFGQLGSPKIWLRFVQSFF